MSALLMRRGRRLLFASIVASIVTAVVACGSKTGLLLPVGEQQGPDAGPDVVLRHIDVFVPPEEDAPEEDALPPLDITPPPDVFFTDCPDAGSTLIYVITQQNNLYSFYPPTAAFKLVGAIACPTTIPDENPFSMAVDRKGTAFIVFSTSGQNPTGDPGGELFRVSTATAACEATGFKIGQQGFSTSFGMSFSGTPDGGQTLYVAGAGQAVSELATIDVLNGYVLNVVGPFSPQITNAELTGTAAGDLFGFASQSSGSSIVQINKANAEVTGAATLPIQQGSGWAFGFWGGDFYLFTAPTGSSIVTRYRPSDGTVVQVAQAPNSELITGAGVSTCAPQQ